MRQGIQIRRLAFGVVATLLAVACAFAENPVSPAFTIDTRELRQSGNSEFDWTYAVAKASNDFIGDTGGYLFDVDGDGVPDWWEVRFSRTRSKISFVAADDDDGDGVINLYEFVAGTDPTNETSILRATISFDDSGSPIIGWTPELTQPEAVKRAYRKFGKVRLNDADWVEIPEGKEGDYNFFKVTVEMK